MAELVLWAVGAGLVALVGMTARVALGAGGERRWSAQAAGAAAVGGLVLYGILTLLLLILHVAAWAAVPGRS